MNISSSDRSYFFVVWALRVMIQSCVRWRYCGLGLGLRITSLGLAASGLGPGSVGVLEFRVKGY